MAGLTRQAGLHLALVEAPQVAQRTTAVDIQVRHCLTGLFAPKDNAEWNCSLYRKRRSEARMYSSIRQLLDQELSTYFRIIHRSVSTMTLPTPQAMHRNR